MWTGVGAYSLEICQRAEVLEPEVVDHDQVRPYMASEPF